MGTTKRGNVKTLRALQPLTLLASVNSITAKSWSADTGPKAGIWHTADVRYSRSARKYTLEYSIYTVRKGQKDTHVIHVADSLNDIVKLVKTHVPTALATPLLAALARIARPRPKAAPERKPRAYRGRKET